MIPKTWKFLKRHRRKIVSGGITAAVLGGLYYYFHSSEKDVEDQKVKEFFIERMNFSFSSSQRTANRATRNLLAQTCAILCDELLQLDETIAVLRGEKTATTSDNVNAESSSSSSTSSPTANAAPSTQNRKLGKEEKRELWDKIKVEGIARTITSIYTITLLHMLLSVEVNIIGRYLFLSHMNEEKKRDPSIFDKWPKQKRGKSASSRHSGQDSPIVINDGDNDDESVIELSKETQQQFMSYAGHFQTEGTRQLSEIALQESRRIVEPIPLSQICTPQDVYDLIETIRANVESRFMFTPEEDPPINLCSILLPPEDSQNPNEMHPHLLDLLDELRDVLESEEFVQVFRETSTGCFTILYAQLEKHIIAGQRRQQDGSTAQSPGVDGVPAMHFANLVPKITKEAKAIFRDSGDNTYVDAVQDNNLLMRFCFMTFSLGIEL